MPRRLPTPCRFPGCPALVDPREGYCPAHKRAYKREKDREYDEKRPSAAKRGYNRRWRRARETFLRLHPLCVLCAEQGKITPATVVDHIIPHRGDPNLFWDTSNWQSLCKRCHDAKTATQDGGFGRPQKGLVKTEVFVIAGPPGSGKTTYVREHMQRGDLVVDLDPIKQALTLSDWYAAPDEILPFALEARDAILRRLERPSEVRRAWVILMGARRAQREALRQRFGAKVIVLETPEEVCLERIAKDERRVNRSMDMWRELVRAWWAEYEPDSNDEVIR